MPLRGNSPSLSLPPGRRKLAHSAVRPLPNATATLGCIWVSGGFAPMPPGRWGQRPLRVLRNNTRTEVAPTKQIRKGKAHERRDMGKERPPDLTGTSGSGRRTQRPQVHARAEQIQTVFQTCTLGPGPQTRGSLGTFHPWKVPRPRAKYPPSPGRWGQRPLRNG